MLFQILIYSTAGEDWRNYYCALNISVWINVFGFLVSALIHAILFVFHVYCVLCVLYVYSFFTVFTAISILTYLFILFAFCIFFWIYKVHPNLLVFILRIILWSNNIKHLSSYFWLAILTIGFISLRVNKGILRITLLTISISIIPFIPIISSFFSLNLFRILFFFISAILVFNWEISILELIK